MRRYRIERKQSLSQVARILGVSYQQLQKYERGQDRISFDRVFTLLAIYGTEIDCFLADIHYEAALAGREDPLTVQLADRISRLPDAHAKYKTLRLLDLLYPL